MLQNGWAVVAAEQVGADEWRAGLWLQALQDQDQGSEPGGRQLSQRLYACFKGTRLQHMHLEPGVQVKPLSPLQLLDQQLRNVCSTSGCMVLPGRQALQNA